jgi:hypothetical protein
MTVYYVDDGGSSTSPYDTWAKAATSINDLDTAIAFASGDIVYFGHDHNCQAENAASLAITGPTSGLPVIFISATTGSSPATYQKGTGTQIDTTEGATFDVTFDGSFGLEGILVKAGRSIVLDQANTEGFVGRNCTFAPGPTGSAISTGNNSANVRRLNNLIVDLSQDGTTDRSTVVFATGTGTGRIILNGITFINAAYRTGTVFNSTTTGTRIVAGADFSGFTNASLCEICNANLGQMTIANCKTAGTFALLDNSAPSTYAEFLAVNVGPTDNPAALQYHTYFGDIASSTSIYRSSGATIEGIANSWLVTTTANCNEYAPFHSPWMPSRVATAGTKNFDVFISNDTADFLDSEVWIELERRTTVGSPLWTLASDQRATITTTPVAQDDDTTSTWVGAGPAYTYKQRLRITAAVEPGQYRVRVVTGVASIASSRNFYVDPDVTVT